MGNELSLGTTFAALSLFLFIQKPINVLPRFVATLSSTLISSGEHATNAGVMRESPAAGHADFFRALEPVLCGETCIVVSLTPTGRRAPVVSAH